MKKFVVKLSLNKKTVSEKVEFGQHVHDSMNGNANFTTPVPTLGDLKTAYQDLNTAATNADGGGALLISIMHDKEVVFDTVMTAMGKYVDSIAMGSETIIKSAGMETKKQSSPIGLVAQVTGVNANPGALSGSIDLGFDKVHGKLVYLVYMKADGEADDQYKLVAVPSRSKVTIKDLVSLKYYWFKVSAVGTAGIGPISDPFTSHAA